MGRPTADDRRPTTNDILPPRLEFPSSMFDTATHLWRTADKSTRLQAAEAFWKEERPDHAQAVAFIAQRLKVRPKTARNLPPERKASYLAQFDNLPEAMYAGLWTAFHLAHRREMLSMFLDALAIPHKDGMFEGENVAAPTVEALTPAIRQVLEKFGPDEVRRYLSILTVSDPVFWGGLPKAAEEAGLGADPTIEAQRTQSREELP
jgi:hypothetical protein